MFFLLILILILVVIFCGLVFNRRNGALMCDDEVTTTVTTSTTNMVEQPQYQIAGNLQRQYDGTQPFVTDPVDMDKVWLNTTDDMYEDGAGKIWRLV